jgi:hypothetical protein
METSIPMIETGFSQLFHAAVNLCSFIPGLELKNFSVEGDACFLVLEGFRVLHSIKASQESGEFVLKVSSIKDLTCSAEAFRGEIAGDWDFPLNLKAWKN